jgi:hypothetical protein
LRLSTEETRAGGSRRRKSVSLVAAEALRERKEGERQRASATLITA